MLKLLASARSLLWSTLLGGSDEDWINDIAVDAAAIDQIALSGPRCADGAPQESIVPRE